MEFSETVQQRQSIKSYQTDKIISDTELDGLMQEVVLSPSSFNLQHWKFIAVKSNVIKKKSGKRPGIRSRLKPAQF
jgi:nitroreductase